MNVPVVRPGSSLLHLMMDNAIRLNDLIDDLWLKVRVGQVVGPILLSHRDGLPIVVQEIHRFSQLPALASSLLLLFLKSKSNGQ